MNPLVLVWIVFGCVFGLGLLAMRLRTALPDHHLSDETKDTVKIAMGLLATISALVLGLMVASAKGSYDAQKNDVVAAAAKFVVLDRMLAHYGPETTAPRALLHRSAENMLNRLWPESASEPVQLDPSISPGILGIEYSSRSHPSRAASAGRRILNSSFHAFLCNWSRPRSLLRLRRPRTTSSPATRKSRKEAS